MVFFLRVFLCENKHITSISRLYKLRSVPNMKKTIVAATMSIGLLGLTACGSSSENVAETEAGNVDRKSTRLNSSHVASSYAVFCLKKKRTAAIRPHSD